MRISLFSQSLFALPLDEAIEAVLTAGYSAVELACIAPHLDLDTAKRSPGEVAAHMRRRRIAVSALSLFSSFTAEACIEQEVEAAASFIRLAPVFETSIVKLTPGPPGSRDARPEHWERLARALRELTPVAAEYGVRLAVETHMRQLTDTLESSKRLLELAPTDAVGLTVDFSNMAFAGENQAAVVRELGRRTYNTHIKNGFVEPDGSWRFGALDRGLTDYAYVLLMLRDSGYDGYLTVECLGSDARMRPLETAKRDLSILQGYLRDIGSYRDTVAVP